MKIFDHVYNKGITSHLPFCTKIPKFALQKVSSLIKTIIYCIINYIGMIIFTLLIFLNLND